MGCATSSDVSGLKAQIDDLAKELKEVRVRQADQAEELAWVGRQVTETQEVSKQTQEQVLRQDRHLEEAMRPLQSRMSLIEGAILKNDDRLRQIETKLKLPSPPPLTFGAPIAGSETLLGQTLSSGPLPPTEDSASRVTGEGELYDRAFSALSQGNPAEAANLFERYLKSYPTSELAPKARYFLAESHYQLKDYERAIVELDTFIRDYPASELVPSAYLRQGEAFEALGDFYDATIVYKKILKDFPASQASVQAKAKLGAIEERLKR